MSSIFERLDFNFPQQNDDRIPELSEDVTKHLESFKLMADWQLEDVANNTTSGYLQNPVASVTNNIITICNDLQVYANSANIISLETAAISTANVAQEFYDHTERVSGQVDPELDTTTKPHYVTAIGIGRMMMYIVNQNDGITNTAPVLGSFTSVMVKDELEAYRDELESIGESVLAIPVLEEIQSFMNTRREHDENFYTKSKTIVDNVAKTRLFSNMGESQNFLLRNYLGTSKLIERLDK